MSFLDLPITRRQLFTVAGVTGAVALGGIGWTASLYQTTLDHKLTVASYDLATVKWPKDRAPLKIAFLADLHVGCPSVDLTVLNHIVNQVNKMGADIILIGGDFQIKDQKHHVKPLPISEVIGQLRSPLGVFAVLGNHDWQINGPGMRNTLEWHGIPVLENQSLHIQQQGHDFWLVGLEDYTTRKPDYQKAVTAIDTDAPRIVLSHDPTTFKDVDDNIVVQLSGHTHGGQVTLPVLGPIVRATPGMPMDWSYGLINHKGRQMIVTSGVGTSILPLKNTPVEVVMLTIRSKD